MKNQRIGRIIKQIRQKTNTSKIFENIEETNTTPQQWKSTDYRKIHIRQRIANKYNAIAKKNNEINRIHLLSVEAQCWIQTELSLKK